MLYLSGPLRARNLPTERHMTTQQLTFRIPPSGTATLTLPGQLTPEAFARLESAVGAALDERRPDADPATADPGSIEFDSWRVRPN
jgi:hypothetical protein